MNCNKAIKGLLAACVITTGLLISAVSTYAAGTGKATDTGVNIREGASTSAKAIGSTTKDVKFDIHAKTKDSAGNVWYKITVSGSTKGYIRSDYVTDVEGDIPTEDGSSSSTTSTDSTTTSTDTTSSTTSTTSNEISTVVVNPSKYQFGTTTGEVSVRASASTKSDKITTTATNQDVAITGELKGTDGMTWYQITYGDTKGFIRSDLLTVQDAAGSTTEEETTDPIEEVDPIEEEPVVTTAPTPAPVLNEDYELRYEPNDEGENIWYLYDHTKGTRQSLDNIFAVMEQSQNMTTSSKEKSSGLKIVVIIMGVVIALLIAGIAVLAFKLRDSYTDWEEDDDDEEDDEDDDMPVSRGTSAMVDDDEELDEDDIRVVKRGKPKKTVSTSSRPSRVADSWKSNKFFEIDDDVEFEFLDIDK